MSKAHRRDFLRTAALACGLLVPISISRAPENSELPEILARHTLHLKLRTASGQDWPGRIHHVAWDPMLRRTGRDYKAHFGFTAEALVSCSTPLVEVFTDRTMRDSLGTHALTWNSIGCETGSIVSANGMIAMPWYTVKGLGWLG